MVESFWACLFQGLIRSSEQIVYLLHLSIDNTLLDYLLIMLPDTN